MNKKVDIAYIISHGFAARMILQTNLLGKLMKKGFKIAVITPDKNDSNLVNYAAGNHIELVEYNPSSSLWSGEYIRLRKYLFEDIKRNPALWEKHLHDLNIAKKRSAFVPLLKIKIYYLIYLLVNMFPFLRRLFAGFERKSLEDAGAEQILRELSPRLLIATYPVNLTESRLLFAGNNASGTDTVIHLLSWDNITCKGYFPQLADHYISWGNIMKEEFIEYYKISDKRIFNTGVPHFDLHTQVSGSDAYKGLLKQKGLNPENPYLFFALGSSYFSPNEIKVVEWLAKKIEQKEFGEMQLVVRPHPQNVSNNAADTILIGRLKAIESNNVAVDWPKMLESNLNWSMQGNDMLDFALLLEGCKLSINSGSTVSIDSLLHDKPVIQTLFDADEELPWWHSVRRVNTYTHCKKLIDLEGVTVVNNFQEFEFEINRYLNNDKYHLEKRQNACFQEVGINDGKSTERVVKAIEVIYRFRSPANPNVQSLASGTGL
ncbi:MAG: CDP-glycerol glycerophosphotransferase family protein [Ferruginibacter sp.]